MPGNYDDIIKQVLADAIKRNPVGTERLNEQSMSSATPIDPIVDQSLTPFASRPLVQSEYDRMMQGARDSSLNLFGKLAFAGGEAPRAPTVPVPRSFAAARAATPPTSAASRIPAGVERGQAVLETAPFGVPVADPNSENIPSLIAKLALR